MGRPHARHRQPDPRHAAQLADRLHAPALHHRQRRGRRRRQPAPRAGGGPRPAAFRRTDHQHPGGAVPRQLPGRRVPRAARARPGACRARLPVGRLRPCRLLPGAAARATLLGGGMSSRLFQEIREKRGLVYSVYSFNSPFLDGGLFGIYAGTGEDEARELLPGHHRGAAQGTALHPPGRARPRPRAGEVEPADVPRKHRVPLRAACPPVADLRPADPDRGNRGQAERGSPSTTCSAPPPACSAARPRWPRSVRAPTSRRSAPSPTSLRHEREWHERWQRGPDRAAGRPLPRPVAPMRRTRC